MKRTGKCHPKVGHPLDEKIPVRRSYGASREIGNYPQSISGFTLIEVLVASAILVVLAFGFLGLQYIIGQNQVSVWRDYFSIDTTNSAISVMVKEIRNVQESGAGSYPLEVANDQEIIFYCDYDYDNAIERIRYTLTGSTLTKGVIEPVGAPATYPLDEEKENVISDIIRNGTDPIYYYYNSDWPEDTINNPLTQENRISNTKLIGIYLKANPKASDPDNDYILESNTKIRTFLGI